MQHLKFSCGGWRVWCSMSSALAPDHSEGIAYFSVSGLDFQCLCIHVGMVALPGATFQVYCCVVIGHWPLATFWVHTPRARPLWTVCVCRHVVSYVCSIGSVGMSVVLGVCVCMWMGVSVSLCWEFGCGGCSLLLLCMTDRVM